jgi:hypothetical protein
MEIEGRNLLDLPGRPLRRHRRQSWHECSAKAASASQSRGCLEWNRRQSVLSPTIGHVSTRNTTMLSTVVIVLLVLWALGLVTSYTLGGVIHILLVIAVVVILIPVIQGRNPLRG